MKLRVPAFSVALSGTAPFKAVVLLYSLVRVEFDVLHLIFAGIVGAIVFFLGLIAWKRADYDINGFCFTKLSFALMLATKRTNFHWNSVLFLHVSMSKLKV